VGQTEAPLMIKPYIETMTQSELMAVMVGGFATVAGGVMAIYVGFLEPHFPGIAGHLMAASVMSAPAALVIAKIMYPETEKSPTRLEDEKQEINLDLESSDANLIDAAARGAGEGLSLTMNVAAMLLAFVALIALINYLFALPSYGQHAWVLSSLWEGLQTQGVSLTEFASCSPEKISWEDSRQCIQTLTPLAQAHHIEMYSPWGVLSLNLIFSYLFAPIAFLIGIPSSEVMIVGDLLGTKLVLNEFVAYQKLSDLVANNQLSDRSILICNYALCGFANFGSIAIQIGGIGGIAPKRRKDLARLGMRAMFGGTLAALMTATIAGVLL
jgi:CNT family concentrative nucleoside transporter